MINRLSKIALVNLPSPPPPGSIQFFDGYFPALPAGTYNINVKHSLTGVTGTPPPFTLPQQSFTVQAPEFFIDTTIVQTIYPPAGGFDQYDQQLPFLVMSDPSLPWERSLVPDSPPSSSAEPTPWIALLIFAEGEIILPANSNNPVSTCAVSQLFVEDPNVLKPTLPTGWVSAEQLASTCQTITIPGATFNAVMPSKDDLKYMTHCRGVNTLDEGEQLMSVMLSNRLAVTNTATAPLRYYAHLVSLEGFADYLGPNGHPIPSKPNASDGLQDVQLVSLFNWTFVSQPESGQSFEALISGLIQSEQATKGVLSLPIPSGSTLPANVQSRLAEGYAPLTFVSGTGEQSFAWYRGPFSAAVPQALPEIGDPPAPVTQANSADALMIYLAEQGLFDLSYAAAWNIGRGLALADANFTQNVCKYRQAANNTLTALAQRMSMPHHSGETNLKNLLASDATRRKFANMMGTGLGQHWTAALTGVRQAPAPAPSKVQRINRSRTRSVLHPRDMLAHPGVVEAVTENLGEIIGQVAQWLDNLSLLYPIPFSYLVPDPRMLPVESIRFFYIDPNWTEALLAGAMSIAIHGSHDVAINNALLPSFTASGGSDMSGMLIRSQLVSGWPKLVVSASLGGVPLRIVRNECLAPNVRLVLFDGIPDTVTLAEPYQGLRFGVEDDGIHPRNVTSYALTGAPIANASPVRLQPRKGVLDIQQVASELATAVGIVPFTPNAVVQWNGTALSTAFVSGNQLTVTVPASLTATPGTVTVTVSNGNAASLPVNFIINAPLEIDAINPTIMQVGADEFVLTVSGTGFAPAAVVQWNGSPLITTVVSAVEATAVVPANLISALEKAAITVWSDGSSSNSVTLNIVGGDPVIDSMQPNVVMAGGPDFTLTVSGSGFTPNAIVQCNGESLPTTFVNAQELTATVKSSLIIGAINVSITVTVNGTASDPATLTIANRKPTIGSLLPSVVMAGDADFTLTVDGVDFDTNIQSQSDMNWIDKLITKLVFLGTGAEIYWNDTPLATTLVNSQQLKANVPAYLLTSAGTVSITVVSAGVTSNTATFSVIGPQPAIRLLEPPSVVAGGAQFTLTVTGGFGAGDFALQMVKAPELKSFTG
ncbi:MAG TPA: IPT/TIG domain-containing protein [Methylobacter sp.]|jgi:hypothetical protein